MKGLSILDKIRLLIWGTGTIAKRALLAFDKRKCMIIGAIDNDQTRSNKYWNDIWVNAPESVSELEYDYIVIAVKEYGDIQKQCNQLGISDDRLIIYCNNDDRAKYEFISDAFEENSKRLKEKIYKYQIELENLAYEMEILPVPKIKSSVELMIKLIYERKSLARFGDGELELMRNCARPWFQSVNTELARKLKETFDCRNEDLLVALSNNFGNLDSYREESAFEIRNYLHQNTREAVVSVIDMDYTYYDAYISRPYLMYKDKRNAKVLFSLFKQLWNKKRVLLVEGEYVRTGVGNDLFESCTFVKRIIGPNKNAFDFYDKILDAIKENSTDIDLILLCLGPTATILVKDCLELGIQTIDIGQIDNEYEWYLRGATRREPIDNKGVPELEEYHETDECYDKEYLDQIVCRIQ